MSLSRTAAVEFSSRVGRALIAVALLAVFVRLLGADRFGSFILFEAVLALATIVVDLGIGSAVQKRMSEGSGGKILITAIGLQTALLVPVGGMLLVLSDVVDGYMGAPLTTYLVPAIAAHQLMRLGLHALRGELRVAEAAVLQLAAELLVLLGGYLLVVNGGGVTKLIWAFIGSRAAVAALALFRLNTPAEAPTRPTISSILQFSKYNFVASGLGGSMYKWIDTFLIGLFLTQELVTAYETAWRVSMSVALASQAIGSTMFPQVSDWHAEGRLAEIRRTVSDGLSGALVVVFPAIVGSFFFASSVLSVAFGTRTSVAAGALVILVVGKFPEAVNNVVSRTLFGLDKPRPVAFAAMVFIVLNLSLNVLLIPRFGLIGAAVGTTVAFFVNTGLNVLSLNEIVSVKPQWRTIGVCVVAAVLMGVVLSIVTIELAVESLTGLAAVIGVGSVVYIIGLAADNRFRSRLLVMISLPVKWRND
ncbi:MULTISPECIES: polysaccharide biosynthesis C-terminal domain-containing protein [Haloarcula]|uniref:oligosaccharide flippase family protein n=1 Tax=Haloarcula TaxID=2237 RepID=UPI000F8F6EA2|nr:MULTISPECIES: polysaccharide biosynthesis C-terminal domain-containing protein [Haloarcula]NHX41494.1 oligosaccharide flippase family protein [Haloarcula sp. R1-2]